MNEFPRATWSPMSGAASAVRQQDALSARFDDPLAHTFDLAHGFSRLDFEITDQLRTQASAHRKPQEN
jgi:hypothetical protein